MDKFTLLFVDYSSVIPIVRFALKDGKEIYAIIDSGSESTLVDKKFKKQYLGIIQSTNILGKMKAMGIGGEKEMVVMETIARIPMKTDKGEDGAIEIKACVDNLSTLVDHMKRMHNIPWEFSLLIGGDTLRVLSSRIDYRKKTVTFFTKARRK